MNMTIRAIFLTSLILGTPVALTGSPGVDRSLGFEDGEMVFFGSGTTDKSQWDDQWDLICLRTIPFFGELTTPEPFRLDQEYEIQFLPIVDNPEAGDCTIDLYIIDGGKEILAARSRPISTKSTTLRGRARIDALKNPVRVDLSSYKGRTISLKWIVEDLETDPLPAIGNLKLHPKSGPGGRRPHILLICSDAHRYDYAFGDAGNRLMPRLRELSEKAVLYTRAYSNASWTLPSVTSVLTGLFPRYHRTGMLHEKGSFDSLDRGRELLPGRFLTGWHGTYHILGAYPREVVTLPEKLHPAGYNTAMIISNHYYFMSGLLFDGPDIAYHTGAIPGNLVNRAAFDVLDVMGNEQPLFLMVHYMDVHEYDRWYLDREYPDAKSQSSEDTQIHRYRASVEDCDRFLGELLDKWDEVMGFENSLVVFFSDHGTHLQDPGAPASGHGSTMQDVLLRVPLLVKYPESTGIVLGEVDQPVTLVDLYPTVHDLLGLDWEKELIGGESLIRAGERSPVDLRSIFADYQLHGDEMSCVRNDRHKLILNLDQDVNVLIDTSLPLAEKGEADCMMDDPAVEARLEGVFAGYERHAEEISGELESDQVIDHEEAVRQLKALGYFK